MLNASGPPGERTTAAFMVLIAIVYALESSVGMRRKRVTEFRMRESLQLLINECE